MKGIGQTSYTVRFKLGKVLKILVFVRQLGPDYMKGLAFLFEVNNFQGEIPLSMENM